MAMGWSVGCDVGYEVGREVGIEVGTDVGLDVGLDVLNTSIRKVKCDNHNADNNILKCETYGLEVGNLDGL